MKMKFLILSVFVMLIQPGWAFGSSIPEWVGDWQGRNGCILRATIVESEKYKRRYVFRLIIYRTAKEMQEGEQQRNFYTHSVLSDTPEQAIEKSISERIKKKCAEKNKCEEYWEGTDESSNIVPGIGRLKFDRNLVLTSIKIEKGFGIPSSKKCENLQKLGM
jgi:hypothetical protein